MGKKVTAILAEMIEAESKPQSVQSVVLHQILKNQRAIMEELQRNRTNRHGFSYDPLEEEKKATGKLLNMWR